MFERKKNVDCHGPRLLLYDHHLAEPSLLFSEHYLYIVVCVRVGWLKRTAEPL
jgi:hypothetical protein